MFNVTTHFMSVHDILWKCNQVFVDLKLHTKPHVFIFHSSQCQLWENSQWHHETLYRCNVQQKRTNIIKKHFFSKLQVIVGWNLQSNNTQKQGMELPTLMVTFPLVIFLMLNPTVGIMSSLNWPDCNTNTQTHTFYWHTPLLVMIVCHIIIILLLWSSPINPLNICTLYKYICQLIDDDCIDLCFVR